MSHSLKTPDGLRGLAPQSLFVAANAVKQGRVKIGEAQETLGDGAGLRPWCERRARGRRRQRFLVAGRRIVSSVRAGGYLVAIGLSDEASPVDLIRGRSPALVRAKFRLNLKQTR